MYNLEKLVTLKKISGTRRYVFGVRPNELQALVFSVKLENASAGISGINPCTIELQTTWNDGMSWETVDYTWQTLSGDGIFKGTPKSTTPRIGPLCRLELVIPANESVVVSIWKPTMDPRDAYQYISSDLAVTASTGFEIDGVPTTVVLDTVTPTNNTPLPVTIYSVGSGEIPETITGNTQYSNSSDRKIFPTVMVGFDSVNSTHKGVKLNSDGSLAVSQSALTVKETIFYSHAVPVTTLAWTEIVASTSAGFQKLDIFDGSGELLVLGVGALGAEVEVGYITPGGGILEVSIPVGSRLAIKAVSANTADGYLAANAY